MVGGSIDGNPASGNTRAYLWQNGVMTDLNTLVPADSPLYLLVGFAINDVGEIAGFGVSSTGNIHGFLATPSKRSKMEDDRENAEFDEQDVSRQVGKVVLTENGRKQLQKLLRLQLPGDRPLDPQ